MKIEFAITEENPEVLFLIGWFGVQALTAWFGW